MNRICPFTNQMVLYLDCLDCDDKKECRNNGRSVSIEPQKPKKFGGRRSKKTKS